MANKVALVSDSTANLPREWVEKYNIPIVTTSVKRVAKQHPEMMKMRGQYCDVEFR